MKDKLLVVIEEVPPLKTGTTKLSQFGKFKEICTASKINIEKKGKDIQTEINRINLVLISNDEILRGGIGAGDRRHNPIFPSISKIGDVNYFNAVIKECESIEAVTEFVKCLILANGEEFKLVNTKYAMKTNYKDDLMEPSIKKFVTSMFSGLLIIPENIYAVNDKYIEIEIPALYDLFLIKRGIFGFSYLNIQQFVSEIENLKDKNIFIKANYDGVSVIKILMNNETNKVLECDNRYEEIENVSDGFIDYLETGVNKFRKGPNDCLIVYDNDLKMYLDEFSEFKYTPKDKKAKINQLIENGYMSESRYNNKKCYKKI